jgi:hypothetical protein
VPASRAPPNATSDTAKTNLQLKRKLAAWDDDIRINILRIHPL